MYYLKYFITFSFIGHIIEKFIYQNKEPGILFGPYTPIYGIGIVVILLVDKHIIKSKNKFFYTFIINSIILTILEFIGGYTIEIIFKEEFWNYYFFKYHIGKYIALEMSIIWGIAAIITIYIIKPFLDKKINRIPKYPIYIISFIMLIDFIIKLTIH